MKRFLKLAMLALVFAATVTSCTVVDNSEIGLRYKKFSVTEQGKLEAENVTGYTWYNPFTERVFTYPVYIQRVDYKPFTVTTRDAAEFHMDPVLAYQLDRDKAVYVFNKYRKSLDEIEAGYMRTCIYDAYRICANKYTSDELMANRAQFEKDVRDMLNKSLGDEGFTVTEFTSQITPPESLRKTIDEKNQAVQNALRAENQVKEAEANAKIAIAKAQGEADALKIQADGEAYYNRTVAASLNPLLVQQYAIEKWDGDLPMYTGSGAVPFIQIGSK